MTDSANTDKANRIYRDDVLRYITDHPGEVVYRDIIAEEINRTPEQVAGTVQRFIADGNDLAKDITIVVKGRAWRYMPSTRVQRAAKKPVVDAALSNADGEALTTRIRAYFMANPNRIIYIQELFEQLNSNGNLEMAQVKIGVNNARHYHTVFGAGLSVAVAGRAWLYTPPADGDVTPSASSVARPTVSPPPAKPLLPATSQPKAPQPKAPSEIDVMLIERLGKTEDGGMIVRDEEQNLYRLYRM